MTLGLFAGQTGGAGTVLDGIQGHLDLITHGDFQGAVEIDELGTGDDPFGLQAGVDHHHFGRDGHHGPGDDGPRLQLGDGKALFKEFGEAFAHGLKVS